ncbi:helix-turn-helix transcriptional regulator [Sinorhizobium sp. 7-81]|uniref:helix-turn-helix domain-containing protein n=1 Tax=unclassified Sinorhizobium TaxID=2613772 RepID=UPI0024C361DE|nr:helix-turn-helix transcriptional regulator [Sinorhizobium sp. 8-89]MDK1389991.1 helix-turn-helix transcriptional regulator [Sinorhizobium sp. 7-81]MDK1494617.1 helix-turn-helix transcriptional regulator [Sinorhizobium sp. 8-89]
MLSAKPEKKKRKPDAVDVQVGCRIRQGRVRQNMSQAALGKAIGVTFQQVQKYENGSNRVGASRLKQISVALDVQPGYFFEGISDEFQASGRCAANQADLPPEVIEFAASEEGIELIRAFSRVGDFGVRSRLVMLVKSLGQQGR